MTKEISAERKIRDALVDLLVQKPFHKITVTDIIKNANINRSTYYYHYYDIDEVLDKVIKVAVEDLLEKMLNSISTREKFTVDKSPSTKVMFDHIYRYKKYYANLMKSDVSFRFANKFVAALTEFNYKLNITFEQSSSEMFIDRDMHANSYSYAIFGQLKYWVDHHFEYSSEYMSEQLTNFMLGKVNNLMHKN